MHTALENLNLARRQVEALRAQRMSAGASLAQAKSQLHQAQVNLERTRILSPVDGYVMNLLAQLGDYVNVGVNTISVVDAIHSGSTGSVQEDFRPIAMYMLAELDAVAGLLHEARACSAKLDRRERKYPRRVQGERRRRGLPWAPVTLHGSAAVQHRYSADKILDRANRIVGAAGTLLTLRSFAFFRLGSFFFDGFSAITIAQKVL